LGTATFARSGNDFSAAGVAEVAERDVDAAGEGGIVGHEIQHHGSVAEQSNVRAAAGTAAGEDFSAAIAVDIARGNADSAGEVGIIGEKAIQHGAVLAANYGDVRTAAGAGAANDVRGAVAIDVARRHVNAADEVGIEREELTQQLARDAVVYMDV